MKLVVRSFEVDLIGGDCIRVVKGCHPSDQDICSDIRGGGRVHLFGNACSGDLLYDAIGSPSVDVFSL